MIKVLSLVPYRVLPARIGGQRAIALFYKYLARHLPLTCITTRNNDAAMAEGYKVLNMLSASPLRYINIFYFFTLRKLIREQQFTHLLLEHPYYGWLGVWLKRATGVKLIIRSHNIEGLRWKSLGKWWWKILWHYEAWTHRNADHNFFMQDADKAYAIQYFSLLPQKCIVITYGIEWNTAPGSAEKELARQYIINRHGIPAKHHILFFNGAFNYPPNSDALDHIIHSIRPLLQKDKNFRYRIIICGKDIPARFMDQQYPDVIIAGFVDDIASYFKGAHVFLNPLLTGGGIKTKLVEALAYDTDAVSTENGAVGIDPSLCNHKLTIVPDGNWPQFAEAIIRAAANGTHILPAFFDHFYWDNIAKKAAAFIVTGPPGL